MSRRKPAVWARGRTSPGIDPESGEGSANWGLEKIGRYVQHGAVRKIPLTAPENLIAKLFGQQPVKSRPLFSGAKRQEGFSEKGGRSGTGVGVSSYV